MAKVIVVHGQKETIVVLKEGINIVGRARHCQVQINDPTMSREHCEINVQEDSVTITDKGSRNGTIVNGKKMQTATLNVGDMVQAGDAIIFFEERESLKSDQDPEAKMDTVTTSRIVIKDFSIWVPTGLSSVIKYAKTLIIILIILTCSYLILYGYKSLQKAPANQVVENLIDDPSFESDEKAIDELWVAQTPLENVFLTGQTQNSKISRDRNLYKTGRSSLLVEKSASDLFVNVTYKHAQKVEPSKVVDASIWCKFTDFLGYMFLKITWLNKNSMPILAELSDPPSASTSGLADQKESINWTKVGGEFLPPAGAVYYEISICLLGGAGRSYFDDINLENRQTLIKTTHQKLSDYSFSVAKNMLSFCIFWKNMLTIADVNISLYSEKEGYTPGYCIKPFQTKTGLDRISNTDAILLSPSGLKETPCFYELRHTNGEITVIFSLVTPQIKNLNELILTLNIPNAESVSETKEKGGLTRFSWAIGYQRFTLQYPEPIKVETKNFENYTSLIHHFPINQAAEVYVTGFKFREIATSTTFIVEKIENNIKMSIEKEDYSSALKLNTELLSLLNDKDKITLVQKEITRINEIESLLWHDIELSIIKAQLTEKKEYIIDTQQKIDRYLSKFSAPHNVEKAEKARNELNIVLNMREYDYQYAQKLLERARTYLSEDKRRIAAEILRTIVQRFPNSEIASEANELLINLTY